MKQNQKQLYMDIAVCASKNSKARRLKVGAVLVKDDNPISLSWNGTPPGWDNNCENMTGIGLVTKPEVLHAEENIIGKMARDKGGCKDATMFITHSPCLNCSRLMWKAGITTVIYQNKYRDDSGIDFLIKAGVKVEQLLENLNEEHLGIPSSL